MRPDADLRRNRSRSGRRRRRLGGSPGHGRRDPHDAGPRRARMGAPHGPDQLSSAPPRSGPPALSGLPGWAALPSAITAVSLIVAATGMYWDISIHIADGRDAGPFANPSHFLILFGLFGTFVAGFLRDRAARGQAQPGRRPARRGLVRAARRHRAARGQHLRPARLPARRLLAPDLRPGRDALGPNPSDDDRRRGPRLRRPGHPARRGQASPSATPIAPPALARRSPP